ncbi:5'/3'-nucleotidase SurE [Bacillus pseudomycoides]|uniref:5'/3'-nucleotidase SurE n=1 Tax=Bacillus pseudomycoides TaxID=64104 RepID=UPI003D1C8520
MNILIVNDDGWKSEGSYLLKETLQGSNNVYCYFPYINSSGYSQKISLNSNITISKVDYNYYKVYGTPVDCVLIAIRDLEIKGIKINLVISGINDGLNYGTPICYSGTIAAALEASNYGIPSIAFSYEGDLKESLILENIDKWVLDLPLNKISKNSILNINIKETECSDYTRAPILIENEIIDYSFRLPSLKAEKNGYRISVNNSVKNNTEKNFLMIGIYNRFSGFILNESDQKLLQELKRNIKNSYHLGV